MACHGTSTRTQRRGVLFLATAHAKEMQDGAALLFSAIRTVRPSGLVWHYLPLPDEHHRTIYPVAALKAFRTLWPATPP